MLWHDEWEWIEGWPIFAMWRDSERNRVCERQGVRVCVCACMCVSERESVSERERERKL